MGKVISDFQFSKMTTWLTDFDVADSSQGPLYWKTRFDSDGRTVVAKIHCYR